MARDWLMRRRRRRKEEKRGEEALLAKVFIALATTSTLFPLVPDLPTFESTASTFSSPRIICQDKLDLTID